MAHKSKSDGPFAAAYSDNNTVLATAVRRHKRDVNDFQTCGDPSMNLKFSKKFCNKLC